MLCTVNLSLVKATAELQFTAQQEEADKETPLWMRFKEALDSTLQITGDLFARKNNCNDGLLSLMVKLIVK